jgi:lipid A 3-O-deacylase
MSRHQIALLISGLCWFSACQAESGIAIEGGQGDATSMGQISFVHQWKHTWYNNGSWHMTGYWDVSVGHWRSNAEGGRGIWDLGLTPVFRYRPKSTVGVQPYVEGAIGVHLISHIRIDNERDLSTAFLFGDHLGFGVVFGEGGRFELGYRFQHLSNADIKEPNPGINFQQIRFTYLF